MNLQDWEDLYNDYEPVHHCIETKKMSEDFFRIEHLLDDLLHEMYISSDEISPLEIDRIVILLRDIVSKYTELSSRMPLNPPRIKRG